MKKGLIALALCCLSMNSFASLCSDSLETHAQEYLDKVKSLESVGVASKFELLLAEKAVLEAKLCKDSLDTESFVALTQNVAARLKNADELFKAGAATQRDVDAVKFEKAAVLESCKNLIAVAKRNADVGMKTQAEVQALIKACK